IDLHRNGQSNSNKFKGRSKHSARIEKLVGKRLKKTKGWKSKKEWRAGDLSLKIGREIQLRNRRNWRSEAYMRLPWFKNRITGNPGNPTVGMGYNQKRLRSTP